MEKQSIKKQDLLTMLVGFGLVIAVIAFFVVKGMFFKDKSDDRTAVSVSQEQTGTFPVLDAKEILRKVFTSNPPRIFDFRSIDSYQAIHIPGSTRMDADGVSKLDLLEGDEIFIIAPDTDENLQKIREALDSTKTRYASIKDGIVGWQSAGGTVITYGDPSSSADQSKVTLVTPDEFTVLLKGTEIRYRLLDVRSGGTPVEGALRIPLNDIESRRDEIPPATNIALCGENGLEAFLAAVRLFDLGFYTVKTLDGGCAGVTGN
ncbi:MAG: rhodanese-like domain-containing protein [Candidatus Moranbacteria bacterium]|nr:rhodanese-like domain-containing protein [Candidatus Moranbacteria bacterium]